jgi:xylulose-5-phosphate/fructose-6-phosphate phosphoketolase
VRRGASIWDWASNDDGEPDVVFAGCGTIPTMELLASARVLREELPAMRIRFVNVTNLFTLARPEHHPDGMPDEQFDALFTTDRPVLFNFHGYPSAVHQLIHRRPRQERFHVKGYIEEGTTTTPFDLLAMNGVDRYHLAIEALSRVDVEAAETVGGMSGEFAVRSIPDALGVIERLRQRLEETRTYIRDVGNDPPDLAE